jgi:hypothetical protein
VRAPVRYRVTVLRSLPYFLIDLVLVAVFVVIGRASHGEDVLGGFITTFWPFAVALFVAWLIGQGWRSPRRLVPNGILIFGLTWAVGILLRAAAAQGIEIGFIIVSFVVLGVFLLGWRAIAKLVARARA